MPSFRKQDERSQAVKRVMRKVHDAIVKAYAFRVDTDHIDQAKLADKLGIDKAIVSRRLSGASNMTERTLAETFWALDHELVIDAIPREKFVQGNASAKPIFIEPGKDATLPTTKPVAKGSPITVSTTAGVKVSAEIVLGGG